MPLLSNDPVSSPACPSSCPSSFYTAPRLPMSIADDDILPAAEGAQSPRYAYHEAVPVNVEVKDHCHIYLDEQIYSTALTLINDLVVTGASHPNHKTRPAVAPDSHHIELTSALLLHPRPTSQKAQNLVIPSRAITILRNALLILGPRNANLKEALSFSPIVGSSKPRRSRKPIKYEDGSSASDTEDKQEHINGVVANSGRTRRCAKDFWHTVGWAFNCSVVCPKRWKVWKVWLDYMLDALEADWADRQKSDESKNSDNEECWEQRRQSLLVKYLAHAVGQSYAMKRIVRSAFADGGAESLKDFPEVFPNETKRPKYYSGQKRKRDDLKGKPFGNHDDEDEAEFESDDTSDSSQDVAGDDTMSGEIWSGGMDSMPLRQRVVMLLSRVSYFIPDCFANLQGVYDEIYQCTVRLPLQTFILFMSTTESSRLPRDIFVSLAQLLLARLLPPSAPSPHTIEDRDDDGMTQMMLEKCFLPFAASNISVTDNGRVSILVENFLRILVKAGVCRYTSSLKTAVEKGIMARENKAMKVDKRKRESDTRGKADEGDISMLKASGYRMRCLITVLKRAATIG
ncbi:uncharacterized protein RSE6_06564 [Rhynchosporium secalis]|uniref:Uncharacterized protein n=1 Tax=Rhynchosporium secalis TaxID=38038 RepID=A0A1E1MAQ4_RHYSE|nr:uncharacterized protein RSE6_06564 [Rhynchosporium secalis]